MKSYIALIAALALVVGTVPAIAQTVTATVPYGQTSALPAAAGSPAMPSDPNAPRWMLLEGYGRHGELRQHCSWSTRGISTPRTTTAFTPRRTNDRERHAGSTSPRLNPNSFSRD
jgi:hypothetical protein